MLFTSIKLAAVLSAAAIHAVTATVIPRQAACSALPASVPTPSVSYLPDPFTNVAGQKVTTLDQWNCRQKELSQLFQKMELGAYPPKPSSVTASISGSTLTINVSDGGKSISFTVSITYPSGSGPFPAIIAYEGGSLPAPAGVAIINYSNSNMAQQTDSSSRGKGLFYNLYGSSHSAGALLAWAWGVDRILDALELVPSAKINPQRVGVTGCSRNGKGALVAGAFVQRIALTLPQESGSGGDASWRISDSIGSSTQTASEIIGENVWFSTLFNPFVSRIPTLPFDHHELAALVAPRPLLAIENTDYVWLGPLSSFGAMTAARYIYQALGATQAFGFSQVGGHSHCAFPSSQQSDLNAYVNRYLKDQTGVTTGIFRTTGNYASQFSESQWIPWKGTVPVLTAGGGSSPTGTPTGTPTSVSSSSTSAESTVTDTSTSVVVTPTSVPAPNCANKWAQCGGSGWSGATCCASGATCEFASDLMVL
ncbi:carbohydrate esterase family 15 protein [Rutstroemia sp. NJR-2017a BVV2]|nr:carbohydrate esterase family 15 protein [Rutstroemia sp. NJR-2017a BVV2]